MKLIFTILGTRKVINQYKLEEMAKNLGKKDTILVSGQMQLCVRARKILGDLGVKQNRILLDIKAKRTKKFVKEYMNDYDKMLFISENLKEELLIKYMFKGHLEIKRVGRG